MATKKKRPRRPEGDQECHQEVDPSGSLDSNRCESAPLPRAFFLRFSPLPARATAGRQHPAERAVALAPGLIEVDGRAPPLRNGMRRNWAEPVRSHEAAFPVGSCPTGGRSSPAPAPPPPATDSGVSVGERGAGLARRFRGQHLHQERRGSPRRARAGSSRMRCGGDLQRFRPAAARQLAGALGGEPALCIALPRLAVLGDGVAHQDEGAAVPSRRHRKPRPSPSLRAGGRRAGRPPHLDGGRPPVGGQGQRPPSVADARHHVADHAVVAAVQAVGHAQEGGECPHRIAAGRAAAAGSRGRRPGGRLAVVAGVCPMISRRRVEPRRAPCATR